jgi:hypothetical protein
LKRARDRHEYDAEDARQVTGNTPEKKVKDVLASAMRKLKRVPSRFRLGVPHGAAPLENGATNA